MAHPCEWPFVGPIPSPLPRRGREPLDECGFLDRRFAAVGPGTPAVRQQVDRQGNSLLLRHLREVGVREVLAEHAVGVEERTIDPDAVLLHPRQALGRA